jgi:catechol 2,3-dioxygenase-like lactoylglutathione lyase family enzyme
MDSSLYHLQLNINFANKDFYQTLMEFLGWSIIFATEDLIGYKSKTNGDIWFVESEKNTIQDYDSIGLNHIALRVNSQKDFDELVKFMQDHDIVALFDTPRHRAEFANSETETYYQVMFKSPDNILFEVVYIGLTF